MKRFILTICFLIVCLLFPQTVSAQEVITRYSGTTGTATMKTYAGKGITAYHVSWTSTSAGGVTGTITNIQGTIERVSFGPVASASPSANYDTVLTDLAGVDVLQGEGANQSATTAADVVPLIAETVDSGTTQAYNKVAIAGNLSYAVTNAGNAKSGLFTIYVSN